MDTRRTFDYGYRAFAIGKSYRVWLDTVSLRQQPSSVHQARKFLHGTLKPLLSVLVSVFLPACAGVADSVTKGPPMDVECLINNASKFDGYFVNLRGVLVEDAVNQKKLDPLSFKEKVGYKLPQKHFSLYDYRINEEIRPTISKDRLIFFFEKGSIGVNYSAKRYRKRLYRYATVSGVFEVNEEPEFIYSIDDGGYVKNPWYRGGGLIQNAQVTISENDFGDGSMLIAQGRVC